MNPLEKVINGLPEDQKEIIAVYLQEFADLKREGQNKDQKIMTLESELIEHKQRELDGDNEIADLREQIEEQVTLEEKSDDLVRQLESVAEKHMEVIE